MTGQFQKVFREAVDLLHQLTTKDGILASTIEADNYKRIWARDSIVSGIAGMLLDDAVLKEGLKASLYTLAAHQHPLGMIPSNVLPGSTKEVSYGSLVGRVDTNSWFVVGACIYYLNTGDEKAWNQLKPNVMLCRQYLNSIEYNNKGWVYTPLSGNWADEYPIHGYTLYDNVLRIWGEKLWCKITQTPDPRLDTIEARTWLNFWPGKTDQTKLIYQEGPYNSVISDRPGHFGAFILPGKYDMRFDAAGNSLALLLHPLTETQKVSLTNYLTSLHQELGKHLIPAFWPVITKNSPDWELMKGNFSYDFKNDPGCFHNGGIWPVWMGLFCLGLAMQGLDTEVNEIIKDFTELVGASDHWNFDEFIRTTDLAFSGKTQMGYTASGIVFMMTALSDKGFQEKLHI